MNDPFYHKTHFVKFNCGLDNMKEVTRRICKQGGKPLVCEWFEVHAKPGNGHKEKLHFPKKAWNLMMKAACLSVSAQQQKEACHLSY